MVFISPAILLLASLCIGTVTVQFTSDSSIQGLGWLLAYTITPAAACVGVATVDYRDMALDSATGWVSNDYSAHISSGRANTTHAPVGDAAAWLTGYSNLSNCMIVLQVGKKLCNHLGIVER